MFRSADLVDDDQGRDRQQDDDGMTPRMTPMPIPAAVRPPERLRGSLSRAPDGAAAAVAVAVAARAASAPATRRARRRRARVRPPRARSPRGQDVPFSSSSARSRGHGGALAPGLRRARPRRGPGLDRASLPSSSRAQMVSHSMPRPPVTALDTSTDRFPRLAITERRGAGHSSSGSG